MTVDKALVDAAKLAKRMTTNAFDDEVADLLEAALQDLGVAGVVVPNEVNAIVQRAVITYFLMNFGDPDNYDRLKKSYDEQKAQLVTCTGYTEWGPANG